MQEQEVVLHGYFSLVGIMFDATPVFIGGTVDDYNNALQEGELQDGVIGGRADDFNNTVMEGELQDVAASPLLDTYPESKADDQCSLIHQLFI